MGDLQKSVPFLMELGLHLAQEVETRRGHTLGAGGDVVLATAQVNKGGNYVSCNSTWHYFSLLSKPAPSQPGKFLLQGILAKNLAKTVRI